MEGMDPGMTSDPAFIRVSMRVLEERMRDFDLTDLSHFYTSTSLTAAGFSVNQDAGQLLLAR